MPLAASHTSRSSVECVDRAHLAGTALGSIHISIYRSLLQLQHNEPFRADWIVGSGRVGGRERSRGRQSKSDLMRKDADAREGRGSRGISSLIPYASCKDAPMDFRICPLLSASLL